jgi:hypothetical protein
MPAEHHEAMSGSDSITMAEPTSPSTSNPMDVEKHGATTVDGKVPKTDVTVDAVWGDVGADGPNYRNLGW